MWSKLGAAGAILYLAVFACAFAYPYFDHRTFSGMAMVLLALPWIDYLPSAGLPAAVALNALIIYFVLAGLSWLLSTLWRSRA
jgi:hypothetical protein